MMPLNKIPDGITIQKMEEEWVLLVSNKHQRNIYLLLLNVVGAFYILFAETLLVLDFIDHWRENCSDGLLVTFYACQDILFIFIAKEMFHSIKLLLESQKRVLALHLKEESFGLFLQNRQPTILKEQWYVPSQLQAIYYNRGPHQRGTDTLAGLLNIPYELYITLDSNSTDNWGRFLSVEQLHFLTYLLQDVYSYGREVEDLLG